MKRNLILFLIFFASLMSSCTDSRDNMAKRFLQQEIDSSYLSDVIVKEIHKVKGYEETDMSFGIETRTYIYNFKAIVEFQKEGLVELDPLKHSLDFDHLQIYPMKQGSKWKHVKKGDVFECTGNITMEKTDNGWEIKQYKPLLKNTPDGQLHIVQ